MPATIDAAMYPHIISTIFDFAPNASLFVLRAVSKAWQDRVDERLARHIVLGEEEEDVHALNLVTGELTPFPPYGCQRMDAASKVAAVMERRFWHLLTKHTRVVDLHHHQNALFGPRVPLLNTRWRNLFWIDAYQYFREHRLDEEHDTGEYIVRCWDMRNVSRWAYLPHKGKATVVVFSGACPSQDPDAYDPFIKARLLGRPSKRVTKFVINITSASADLSGFCEKAFSNSEVNVVNLAPCLAGVVAGNGFCDVSSTIVELVVRMWACLGDTEGNAKSQWYIINPEVVPPTAMHNFDYFVASLPEWELLIDLAFEATSFSDLIVAIGNRFTTADGPRVKILTSAEYEAMVGTETFRLETMEEPWRVD